MATICVYGAASDNINKTFMTESEKLGKEISAHGHGIIYGGGATGLMGATARGVASGGGKVVGVTPRFMHSIEPLFECTEIIDTETMAQRKATMEKYADAFIIVPGGIGTFDEFFQAITLKELGQLGNKPLVIFNIDGYYNELYAMMKAADDKGFFRPNVMKMFTMCNTAEECIAEVEKQLNE